MHCRHSRNSCLNPHTRHAHVTCTCAGLETCLSGAAGGTHEALTLQQAPAISAGPHDETKSLEHAQGYMAACRPIATPEKQEQSSTHTVATPASLPDAQSKSFFEAQMAPASHNGSLPPTTGTPSPCPGPEPLTNPLETRGPELTRCCPPPAFCCC